ncbi:hypothetical protein ANCCAN_06837 [Ancylostoma caninum]|uniref:Uncharacterized protein n=1 Tax=Ancylostoma caninum TaxID=29170 RepID=A0A368GRX2_ANCCA|nr:hypothetical protein ANCCAN_06837 [Ancylostoma caninum]
MQARSVWKRKSFYGLNAFLRRAHQLPLRPVFLHRADLCPPTKPPKNCSQAADNVYVKIRASVNLQQVRCFGNILRKSAVVKENEEADFLPHQASYPWLKFV